MGFNIYFGATPMLHILVLEILDWINFLYIVSFHKAGWGSMLIFF